MGMMDWFFGPGIACGELSRRMDSGEKILLLDVRSEPEYRGPEGRVPGVRLMPLPELGSRAREEIVGFEGQVVVVCSRGLRSRLAQRTLRKMGVASMSLEGGVRAWTAAGFEVLRDTEAPVRAPSAKRC